MLVGRWMGTNLKAESSWSRSPEEIDREDQLPADTWGMTRDQADTTEVEEAADTTTRESAMTLEIDIETPGRDTETLEKDTLEGALEATETTAERRVARAASRLRETNSFHELLLHSELCFQ